jgi:hypothetical protein
MNQVANENKRFGSRMFPPSFSDNEKCLGSNDIHRTSGLEKKGTFERIFDRIFLASLPPQIEPLGSTYPDTEMHVTQRSMLGYQYVPNGGGSFIAFHCTECPFALSRVVLR